MSPDSKQNPAVDDLDEEARMLFVGQRPGETGRKFRLRCEDQSATYRYRAHRALDRRDYQGLDRLLFVLRAIDAEIERYDNIEF